MPEFYFFFNIKILLQFKFEIFAYIQLKNKNLNKIKKSSRGVRDSTERPKIKRFWRKGTAKTI